MERSTLGEDVAALSQEIKVLQLVTVEVSGHVNSFSSDDNHFIAGKDKLGYNRGKTAQHVTSAIYNDGLW